MIYSDNYIVNNIIELTAEANDLQPVLFDAYLYLNEIGIDDIDTAVKGFTDIDLTLSNYEHRIFTKLAQDIIKDKSYGKTFWVSEEVIINYIYANDLEDVIIWDETIRQQFKAIAYDATESFMYQTDTDEPHAEFVKWFFSKYTTPEEYFSNVKNIETVNNLFRYKGTAEEWAQIYGDWLYQDHYMYNGFVYTDI